MPKVNPKRIVIATGIFWPEIGGPASYGRLLAGKLSEKLKVFLIAYSPVLTWAGDKDLSFKVVRIWKKIPKGLRHLIYFLRILNLARKADVVYALNAVSAGYPALLAARLFKKKFIVRVPGDYAWEIAALKGKTHLMTSGFQKVPKSGLSGLRHRIQAKVCQKANLVIVPSKYLSSIVEDWGVSPKKIRLVYNGVDFKSPNLTREEARIKIGIAGNIIISIGRLVPWKGFSMLIKIMPELLKLNQYFRLVIIGDGPDLNKLKAIVKNLRLETKVFIVGSKNREELAIYLTAADIFILNSGYEGFSHQILEAMTAGLPVITTTAGGNQELIHQGDNGFMVRYNDEFNLIEAIKTIWQNPELRNHFVEQGRKTVLNFSVEKMLEETENLLTDV